MLPLRCLLPLVMILLGCASVRAEPLPPAASALQKTLQQPDEWYRSDEGLRVVENIVTWQNENGGWWKFYDPHIARPKDLPPPSVTNAPPGDTEAQWRHTSTFDNGATYTELRILARAIRIANRAIHRAAFDRGLQFIFDAQYENGGWPQRFPLEENYGRHITFNDDAMTNVMHLLREIDSGKGDFGFVDEPQRARCREAFARGVDCILACQIKVDGKLTAWCQQHDGRTLAPAEGRTYEPPSISGGESADIALLLMDLPDPDERVRRAIESAVAWYESAKITGKRFQRVEGPQYQDGRDRIMIDDPAAPPLWARFYDIETNRPILMDRDGLPRENFADISWERRVRYAYFGDWGKRVLDAYPKWKAKLAAEPSATRGVANTVASDGSADFKTIQSAIDSIPDANTQPRVIIIKPGIYKERITIPSSKPFITLRGDDPNASKTLLTYDLLATMVMPGTTQPIGTSGTPSTSIDAHDFTAHNLTFENTAGDKGQAVAIKVTGDRAAFYNCRFLGWQDTLYAERGRQYYRDCYIEGRVDFIFGGATAVFDHCTIHSKNGGYITAARTFPEQPFGYVFLDCTLTGEGAPAYLGRPWQWDRGRNASVTFIRTKMGPHICPEGWNQWDRPGNPNTNPAATARYRESGSTDLNGKPIDVSQRVPWSRPLSADEAAKITVHAVLGGDDDWDPTISGGKAQ